jgi:hypothetical protein
MCVDPRLVWGSFFLNTLLAPLIFVISIFSRLFR